MGHILVTGATGFIGSHLVEKLLKLKKEENWEEEIVCLVRSTSFPKHLEGLGIKCVVGDLLKPDTLINAVQGATTIYHLGAELFTVSREKFLATNTEGTRNMLECVSKYAAKSLKRFLYVSSQAAAGPAPDNQPIDETHPFPDKPVSWYGESKMEAEKIVHTYLKKFPITIVRPSAVYGPRDLGMTSTFQATENRIHGMIGFRTRYTGMIYVSDLVQGFIQAARHPKAAGQTYFLTNPDNLTMKEVVKTIARAIKKPFGINVPIPIFFLRLTGSILELLSLFTRQIPIPTRDKARDIAQIFWLCTPAKAKKELDWEATVPLEQGFARTADFYREEKKAIKRMDLESKGVRWTKYLTFSILLGAIIEISADIGGAYHFTPRWFSIVAVLGMWGLTFGSIALLTRTKGFLIQFIPGFLILFGAELLNHYYLHLWKFGENFILTGLEPIWRAVILGVATGFIIPLINMVMLAFYKRRVRLG